MAAPELEALLRVQDHDTAVDQLRHRRANLPALADLGAARDRLAAIDAEMATVGGERDEIAERQAKLESEVAGIESRIAELEKRLYSGTGPARDLQLISHEVDQLKQRRSSLDDDTLAAMEEREPLDTRVDELAAARSGVVADIERLERAVAEAQSAIDAELAGVERERGAAAADVPGSLLQQYERLRQRLGGIGAARLSGNSCSGCHLTLPATELDRLRHLAPGAVETCEQCGRILVP